MDIKALQGAIHDQNVDTVIVSLFAEEQLSNALSTLDSLLSGAISNLIETGDFTGKEKQISVIYPRGGIAAKRIILVGLGQKDSATPEKLRRAAAYAIQKANDLKAVEIISTVHGFGNLEVRSQLITEASLLALYQYKEKNIPTVKTMSLIVSDERDLEAVQRGINLGVAYAQGTCTARDMVNLPPNICTPAYMAEMAEDLAKETGLRIEVLERQQMKALKMGALLAVAQGSDAAPRFIILEHNHEKAKELDTLVLVGKGVTFDTGGYSLKTRDGMVGMKADMAGGAAVIGAMQAIALLDVPLHVVGLIPASDNMVSSTAYRPQEVVTASNGVTIEIISTDAEGRMLLADALVFANRYKPDAVVDIATLTGSAVIALGGQAAALFVTDDRLHDTLLKAAETTHERLWQLPMYSEYNKTLESETADTKNSGGRYGGASIAAAFLQNFVDYPAWAHIDMAGLAHSAKNIPYATKGATGFGVRLLTEFVRQWAQKGD